MECHWLLQVSNAIQRIIARHPAVPVKEASMECHWFLLVSKDIQRFIARHP